MTVTPSSDNLVADRIFLRFLANNSFTNWLAGKFVRAIDMPCDRDARAMIFRRDFMPNHGMEEFLIMADMVSNSTQAAEDLEAGQCQ